MMGWHIGRNNYEIYGALSSQPRQTTLLNFRLSIYIVAMADLYLMQNEFGLFKVGRSIAPLDRLLQIRAIDFCNVAIVNILEQSGHFEESAHIELRQFRLTGEWFDGTKKAKKAICRVFGLDVDTVWPFRYDPNNAAVWLKHLEIARDRAARVKNHNRLLASINRYQGPSRTLDRLIWYETHGQDGRSLHASSKGEYRASFPGEVIELGELVPNYTADVEIALSIWPGQFRPVSWDGDALSCVIGGLRAQRLIWQNEHEKWSAKPRFSGPKRNVPSRARTRLLSRLDKPT